jgi:hypothetical protein
MAPADERGCNLSTAAAVRAAGLALLLSAAISSAASAQTFAGVAKFVGGGALGLALHESAHVIADVGSGVTPGVKKVTFGPIPFFAITHDAVSPPREFVISSAGFWMQHAVSELVLVRHGDLRHEDAAMLKGVLAFNVLASVAYASAAFARTGPDERDTRGMAVSARMDEPLVGAVILAPALLDAARYYGVKHRVVVWASRAAKIGGVLLVIRAAQ